MPSCSSVSLVLQAVAKVTVSSAIGHRTSAARRDGAFLKAIAELQGRHSERQHNATYMVCTLGVGYSRTEVSGGARGHGHRRLRRDGVEGRAVGGFRGHNDW